MTTFTLSLNEQKLARSRAFYVLLAAVFPLALAGFLTAVVFITGAVKWDDGIGFKTKYASFDYPTDGQTVDDQFIATGAVDIVPDGSVVFLVERVDSRYWPKARLGSSPSRFSRKQYISEGKGYKYTIQLLALNTNALARVEKWFETGRSTGKYPGLTDMSGAQVLAQVRVIR